MEPCSFSTCVALMPFYCAVKTSSCVSSLLFHFGFILRKKRTDNHAAEVGTASVKNGTAVRGCPLTPWRALREMEKHEEVFVGVREGLRSGVVVFKILTSYLPNSFLTGRAVSLCFAVLVSTSLISFLSSCPPRVWPFRGAVDKRHIDKCLCAAVTAFSRYWFDSETLWKGIILTKTVIWVWLLFMSYMGFHWQ